MDSKNRESWLSAKRRKADISVTTWYQQFQACGRRILMMMMIWVDSINLLLKLSVVGFKVVEDFYKKLISLASTFCSLIGLCKAKFGVCKTKLSNMFRKSWFPTLWHPALWLVYPKLADACYWPTMIGISSGHMARLAINQAGRLVMPGGGLQTVIHIYWYWYWYKYWNWNWYWY